MLIGGWPSLPYPIAPRPERPPHAPGLGAARHTLLPLGLGVAICSPVVIQLADSFSTAQWSLLVAGWCVAPLQTVCESALMQECPNA